VARTSVIERNDRGESAENKTPAPPLRTEPESTPKPINQAKSIPHEEISPQKEEIIFFKVDSQKKWQDTGVLVSDDRRIIIEYEKGKWSVGKTGWQSFIVDGEGYNPRQCANKKEDDIIVGALVGKIGNGHKIKVGNYYEIIESHETGNVFLRINDGDNFLFDNMGAITVKITIRSR